MRVTAGAPRVVGALCLLVVAGMVPGQRALAQRYLALGDSYTIGESVAERARWPVQLVAQLRARGVELAQPEIIARTGWTTGDLLAALDAAPPRRPYALVSLLIGVNNQFQGRAVEEYARELRTLLQRATALADGNASRVLVLSIPDWGVTPFAAAGDRARIAKEIDRFNGVCRDEVRRIGGRFVDVTPESRRAADDTTLVAHDGLHPSAKMYTAWVELALPAALAAVGPERHDGTPSPERTP